MWLKKFTLVKTYGTINKMEVFFVRKNKFRLDSSDSILIYFLILLLSVLSVFYIIESFILLFIFILFIIALEAIVIVFLINTVTVYKDSIKVGLFNRRIKNSSILEVKDEDSVFISYTGGKGKIYLVVLNFSSKEEKSRFSKVYIENLGNEFK